MAASSLLGVNNALNEQPEAKQTSTAQGLSLDIHCPHTPTHTYTEASLLLSFLLILPVLNHVSYQEVATYEVTA